MRVALACVALAGLACSTPSGARVDTAAPMESAPPGPAVSCAPLSGDALAVVDASPCPLELVDDGGLALRSGGDAPLRFEVELPDPCAASPGRCRWSGAMTDLGPLLVAAVDGPEGELPVDLWLGAALGGERLTFVDLWWGDPSVVDGTEVGPVYALVPAICGERLVLEVAPRLPEGAHLGPPAQLVALSGEYAAQDGGLTRVGDAPAESCARVDLDLP
ncbi:MAG: hypothetical protein R3A79_29515 [Nannocystaceae bacterium]